MTGYAPARVPDRRWDDTSMRFNVFVAGLMGAGALMSVVVGLAESVSSTRGRERLRRHAAPVAQTLSEGVLGGFDSVASSPTGLRPRRHYALAAAVMAVVGVAITARSTDLYADRDFGPIAWMLTGSSGLALIAAASVAGFAALRWPRVPIAVRRFAPGRPPNPHSLFATIPRRGRIAIAVMAGLVVVGGVVVVFAQSWVLQLDRPIYFDYLHAGKHVNRWTPGWFNQFGYAPFLIVVPTIVFMVTFVRCRAVAIAYPAMIAIGGVVFLVLNWTVHRLRPPLSARAGQYTSYPGGHSIQVTLVFLALPLVVWVLTDNRTLRIIGTIIPVGLWLAEAIDNIRMGAHWPTDQLAGLLIAAILLIVIYSVGIDAIRRDPELGDLRIRGRPDGDHR